MRDAGMVGELMKGNACLRLTHGTWMVGADISLPGWVPAFVYRWLISRLRTLAIRIN